MMVRFQGLLFQVLGTDIGTSTDFDGNYSINASPGDILIVSYVGFSPKEITVGQNRTIDITLVVNTELDEIVVTGYGSLTKREVTGSIATLSAKILKEFL